jgi:ribose/xylose/arabinose/galactoside ABC-type transport system permease subunit
MMTSPPVDAAGPPGISGGVPRWFRCWNWLRRGEGALVVAILIALVMTAAVDGNHSYWFRPLESGRDIARNTALLGIFALGAAVVIIAGGIDLSSGSMIAFSGTVCATAMLALAPASMLAFKPVGGLVVAVGCLASLLMGFFVGTLHTWLITTIRLPPFIATLATLVGLRSFARALCETATATLTPTKSALINVADPLFKTVRDNVWIPVMVFLLLALMTWLLLTRTVLGRHLQALGGNEQAARLAGIRTDRVKWFAYCFGSMTAALAGLFYVANESVAQPVNQGRGHELNAIAAAVVGGCSLSGGVGTVPGTVLGTVFLRVVIDAVSKIIKTGADVYEGLIVGIVVVLAVTFAQVGQAEGGGRRLLPGLLGVCMVPVLALLAGSLVAMTAGSRAGVAAGCLALALLIGWHVIENRQQTG